MSSPSPLESIIPDLERLIDELSPAAIPPLVCDLARLRARLEMRLLQADAAPHAPTQAECAAPDRLLSAREAAEVLGVKVRWLYRHAHKVPGMQRLSRRCLRFSEPALRRWIAEGKP